MIVRLIVLLNIAVFALWVFPPGDDLDFMARHFLVSWDSLREGRWWTLLGSAFSHTELWHIFLNMFAFYGFGRVLEQGMGSLRFLRFYLIAGAFASFSHAAVSNFLLHQPDLPALGASGAVSAVILLFSLVFPREKILIMGLIPVPAIVGAILFVGLDVWGLVAQAEGGGLPIGHGAHLGGALVGLVYYISHRWRRRRSA